VGGGTKVYGCPYPGQQYVPCPHPPTPKRKGGVNIFFTLLHIMWKSFFLIFRFISFRIWNCPLAQNFVPLLMKQLWSELKTSDLNVDFLLYFHEQLKPWEIFSSCMDISIPNFKQEYIHLKFYKYELSSMIILSVYPCFHDWSTLTF
jgi:hypothetical protein